MELPVLSFSSLQTCRSTGYGRFYLFEPIDPQKAFNNRQVLLSRKPKRRDVLVTSVFKFKVVLFFWLQNLGWWVDCYCWNRVISGVV
jgi:hypothetical protein